MAKKKIICDTDVIIDYWNIKSLRYQETKESFEKLIDDNIQISAVTKMELLIGAINKSDLLRINRNIEQFDLIMINDQISEMAIQLLQEFNLSHGLVLADSLIAATALIVQADLFTYNIKDYKFISGLNLYKPG